MPNWIELHDTITEHPKTIRLSVELGISIPQTVGHLCCLFTWAIRFKPDGVLKGLSEVEIAMAAKWDGKAGPFIKAMTNQGWIDKRGGRGKVLSIHDWGHYTRGFKKAEADRERKRRGRLQGKSEDIPRNGAVTTPAATTPHHTSSDQPHQAKNAGSHDGREGDSESAGAIDFSRKNLALSSLLLAAAGINGRKRSHLATEYSVGRIFNVWHRASNGSFRSKSGFVISALESQQEVPDFCSEDPAKARAIIDGLKVASPA